MLGESISILEFDSSGNICRVISTGLSRSPTRESLTTCPVNWKIVKTMLVPDLYCEIMKVITTKEKISRTMAVPRWDPPPFPNWIVFPAKFKTWSDDAVFQQTSLLAGRVPGVQKVASRRKTMRTRLQPYVRPAFLGEPHHDNIDYANILLNFVCGWVLCYIWSILGSSFQLFLGESRLLLVYRCWSRKQLWKNSGRLSGKSGRADSYTGCS